MKRPDPEDNRVRLTLTHRKIPTRDYAIDVSGGWRSHLDILRYKAEGKVPPAFTGTSGARCREAVPEAAIPEKSPLPRCAHRTSAAEAVVSARRIRSPQRHRGHKRQRTQYLRRSGGFEAAFEDRSEIAAGSSGGVTLRASGWAYRPRRRNRARRSAGRELLNNLSRVSGAADLRHLPRDGLTCSRRASTALASSPLFIDAGETMVRRVRELGCSRRTPSSRRLLRQIIRPASFHAARRPVRISGTGFWISVLTIALRICPAAW